MKPSTVLSRAWAILTHASTALARIYTRQDVVNTLLWVCLSRTCTNQRLIHNAEGKSSVAQRHAKQAYGELWSYISGGDQTER